MKDVMVDLETLGTVPGCAILSIGAIAFDEFSVAEEGFYVVVSRTSCDYHELHENPETVAWWKGQSPEAQKVLEDALSPSAADLTTALRQFGNFLSQYPGVRVWGNGADFDNPIITCAAHAAGVDPKSLWKGYNSRCYRTVKRQFPDIKLQRSGTHHNALDDARSQAAHLVEICQKRGWKLA